MPPLAFCVSPYALIPLAYHVLAKSNTSSPLQSAQNNLPTNVSWEQLPHHWRHITWMDRDPFRTGGSSGWYLSESPSSSPKSSDYSLSDLVGLGRN
ncbi:hypothetical protein EV356DRAFT_250698 [Viridothelium virens]|uniref:Uncharacterized protein n=1 Tax=Viridothelium virens TaxID=1048519 RepID=A0A6A6H2P3_VIRVR|nr:hypothetical protein EV356DRAFT_250698 [Viridothelium virens]